MINRLLVLSVVLLLFGACEAEESPLLFSSTVVGDDSIGAKSPEGFSDIVDDMEQLKSERRLVRSRSLDEVGADKVGANEQESGNIHSIISDSSYDPDDETINKDNYKNRAVFLLLDKLDHSVREVEVAIRTLTNYKALDILLITCWSKDDLSHKALVKISENKKVVFNGWIFSNSPSLSNMEHPKYYIQLSKCYDNSW